MHLHNSSTHFDMWQAKCLAYMNEQPLYVGVCACAAVCVSSLFVSMYLGHMHTRTGPQTAANKEAAGAEMYKGVLLI